jgi:hypothetical protein
MGDLNRPLTPREQTTTVNTYLDALAWMRSPDAKFRMKDKGSSCLTIAVDALDIVFTEATEQGIEPINLLHCFLISTFAQYGNDRIRNGFLAAANAIQPSEDQSNG